MLNLSSVVSQEKFQRVVTLSYLDDVLDEYFSTEITIDLLDIDLYTIRKKIEIDGLNKLRRLILDARIETELYNGDRYIGTVYHVEGMVCDRSLLAELIIDGEDFKEFSYKIFYEERYELLCDVLSKKIDEEFEESDKYCKRCWEFNGYISDSDIMKYKKIKNYNQGVSL